MARVYRAEMKKEVESSFIPSFLEIKESAGA